MYVYTAVSARFGHGGSCERLLHSTPGQGLCTCRKPRRNSVGTFSWSLHELWGSMYIRHIRTRWLTANPYSSNAPRHHGSVGGRVCPLPFSSPRVYYSRRSMGLYRILKPGERIDAGPQEPMSTAPRAGATTWEPCRRSARKEVFRIRATRDTPISGKNL